MDKLQTRTLDTLKAFAFKAEWPKEVKAAVELLVDECRKAFPYVWALGQVAGGKVYYYDTDAAALTKELFDFNQKFVPWLSKCPAIGQKELEVKFHSPAKGTQTLTLHTLNALYPGAFVENIRAFRVPHLQQLIELFGDPTVTISVKRPKDLSRYLLIAQEWK